MRPHRQCGPQMTQLEGRDHTQVQKLPRWLLGLTVPTPTWAPGLPLQLPTLLPGPVLRVEGPPRVVSGDNLAVEWALRQSRVVVSLHISATHSPPPLRGRVLGAALMELGEGVPESDLAPGPGPAQSRQEGPDVALGPEGSPAQASGRAIAAARTRPAQAPAQLPQAAGAWPALWPPGPSPWG